MQAAVPAALDQRIKPRVRVREIRKPKAGERCCETCVLFAPRRSANIIANASCDNESDDQRKVQLRQTDRLIDDQVALRTI